LCRRIERKRTLKPDPKTQKPLEEHATVKQRIFATLIDWAAVIVIVLVFELIPIIVSIIFLVALSNSNLELVNTMSIISYFVYPLFTAGALVVIFLYFVKLPVRLESRTFGMSIVNVKIVMFIHDTMGTTRAISKDDLSINIKRFFLGLIDSLFWGLIGLILIIKSPNNQCLADRVTKTLIVQEKKVE
ncbi:MAG: RDD family protein, partial [Candidatus Heimdallarchaeota archaeon]